MNFNASVLRRNSLARLLRAVPACLKKTGWTTPTQAAAEDSGRPVVLVLDDDPGTRKMIRFLLESAAGCRVIETRTGAQALQFAFVQRPNLVLCDLHRPSPASGFAFLEAFKAGFPAIPVVVVSGSLTPAVRRQAYRLGAFDTVAKPFITTRLLDAVRIALAKPQSRRRRSRRAKAGCRPAIQCGRFGGSGDQRRRRPAGYSTPPR